MEILSQTLHLISLATTKYPGSRHRPEVDFYMAASKRNGPHSFNFHFQVPGSLATTNDPWSRSRPEVNFHKVTEKEIGATFDSFDFEISMRQSLYKISLKIMKFDA